ncbi:unnamed protein product [Lampetra fluviatilis]
MEPLGPLLLAAACSLWHVGQGAGFEAESVHSGPLGRRSGRDVFVPRRIGETTAPPRLPHVTQAEFPAAARYSVRVAGQPRVLNLQRNRELVSPGYVESHYGQDGILRSSRPNLTRHCFYHGAVAGAPGSSVSASTCGGRLRGLVVLGGLPFALEPLGVSGTGVMHASYPAERALARDSRRQKRGGRRWRRGAGRSCTVAAEDPAWVLQDTKYVEMFMVVDHTKYKMQNRSMERVRQRMLEAANHMDKLYRPLRVRVALVGLEVWSAGDRANVSADANATLKGFLAWRRRELAPRATHDHAQLVTGVQFEGVTVGLAPVAGMCGQNSGAVSEDHSYNVLGLASTMAHEMGHNLGMSHDSTERRCHCEATEEQGGCVLAPRLKHGFPVGFSSCSVQDLHGFLQAGGGPCLYNEPLPDALYGGPVCGNLFLEPGETCDCGTVEECDNPCCNATTCQLVSGARCAHGACCSHCQVAAAGVRCRERMHECDLPELCDGRSARCPDNLYLLDGHPCRGGAAYCYGGLCPTLDAQCASLWGKGASRAPDVCYFLGNQRQDKFGNCGRTEHGFVTCDPGDVLCGQTHCVGGNKHPVTGVTYTLTFGPVRCKVAGTSDGDDAASDPGLVLPGTRCGDGKASVCYQNRCQDASLLGAHNCSATCSGHGVCNNKRECHCDYGWAPPFCSSLTPHMRTVVLALALALGAAGMLALVAAVCHCRRRRKAAHERCSSKHPRSVAGLSNPLFAVPAIQGKAPAAPETQPQQAGAHAPLHPPRFPAAAFALRPARAAPAPSLQPQRAAPAPPATAAAFSALGPPPSAPSPALKPRRAPATSFALRPLNPAPTPVHRPQGSAVPPPPPPKPCKVPGPGDAAPATPPPAVQLQAAPPRAPACPPAPGRPLPPVKVKNLQVIITH